MALAFLFRSGLFFAPEMIARSSSEEYPEPPEAADAILDMQRKIELLAVTYLGLSAEDAGRLRTMTQGSRAKLVEEGVHHALEQRSQ